MVINCNLVALKNQIVKKKCEWLSIAQSSHFQAIIKGGHFFIGSVLINSRFNQHWIMCVEDLVSFKTSGTK